MKDVKAVQYAFSLLHDAVFIVDRQMSIQYANLSASELFGYSIGELNGSSIEMLVPNDLMKQHKRHTANYVRAPKRRQMQTGKRLLGKNKDGEEFPVSISLNSIEFDGELMFCAVVRDLSEMVEMEKKLLQNEKMESLSILVGGVAHDINNVMTAIRGAVYLAKKTPEHSARHINVIESQCEYATDIVKQMLISSKSDSVETAEFLLSDLLVSSEELFRSAVCRDVEIQFNIETKHAYVHGSSTLVRQAVLNLILNAVDATLEVVSPCISVELKELGQFDKACDSAHYLSVSVTDNGHGMESSTMDRIFEPFYTTKPSTKGTGLGLAIVYNVAKNCGGYVTVESVVGKGTTFNLFLPIVDAAASFSHEKKVVHDPRLEAFAGTSVLLVEDNKAVRNITRDVIKSLGCATFSAKNGCVAVKKAKCFQSEIELILMDVSMPKMGGFEAALEIREGGNQVPIIFYSGNSSSFSQIEAHAERLHPFSLLAKPFNALSLEDKILDHIDV